MKRVIHSAVILALLTAPLGACGTNPAPNGQTMMEQTEFSENVAGYQGQISQDRTVADDVLAGVLLAGLVTGVAAIALANNDDHDGHVMTCDYYRHHGEVERECH